MDVFDVLIFDSIKRYSGVEDDLIPISEVDLSHEPYPNVLKFHNDGVIFKFNNSKDVNQIINYTFTEKNTGIKCKPLFKDFDFTNVFIAGGFVSSSLVKIQICTQDDKYVSGLFNTFDDNDDIIDLIVRRNLSRHVGNELTDHFDRNYYSYPDIDFFIYGLDEDEANKKVEYIIDYFSNMLFIRKLTRASAVVTLSYVLITDNNTDINNKYHIQIILRLYKTKSEILHGFDLGSSAVGYDGENIWFTTLSKFSYENKCNIVDSYRRSTTYERRLEKYFYRGFNLLVPFLDISKVEDRIDFYNSTFIFSEKEALKGFYIEIEKDEDPLAKFCYLECKNHSKSIKINSYRNVIKANEIQSTIGIKYIDIFKKVLNSSKDAMIYITFNKLNIYKRFNFNNFQFHIYNTHFSEMFTNIHMLTFNEDHHFEMIDINNPVKGLSSYIYRRVYNISNVNNINYEDRCIHNVSVLFVNDRYLSLNHLRWLSKFCNKKEMNKVINLFMAHFDANEKINEIFERYINKNITPILIQRLGWITVNPSSQLTSSYNPTFSHPREWYLENFNEELSEKMKVFINISVDRSIVDKLKSFNLNNSFIKLCKMIKPNTLRSKVIIKMIECFEIDDIIKYIDELTM